MRKLTGIILLMLVVLSFTRLKKEKKSIILTESKIEWLGRKNVNKKRETTHNGTLNFNNGYLIFEGTELQGGAFEVDMTSLTVTDFPMNKILVKILEDHLKSEDFFEVDKYTISTLVFTEVKKMKHKYNINADLTIKEITHEVNFDMEVYSNSANAKLVVDRLKYDIKFGPKAIFSKVKNKKLDGDFELNVKLHF